MTSARAYVIALVTVPNLRTGRAMAKAVLSRRLAACVNVVPGLESHYWWKEKLERSKELLLLIKTRRTQLTPLEACVLKHHPYDTPEFLVVSLEAGNQRYLRWLRDQTE